VVGTGGAGNRADLVIVQPKQHLSGWNVSPIANQALKKRVDRLHSDDCGERADRWIRLV
jgi:hypothetical protein